MKNKSLGASLLKAYFWLSMALAKMVLDFRKNLKPTQFYMLNIFCLSNFDKKSSPLGVLAHCVVRSAYSWLFMALDLAQMVLEVGKNPKPIQLYMLNILCFIKFAKKSSPGSVLAQGLLLAVYSPGLGPDGPGVPEEP